MAPRHIRPPFNSSPVFQFDPNTRTDLIVTEGFQLLINVERDPLHELYDSRIANLSVAELGDAGLALQNRYGHTERDAEFSFQGGFRHGVDQRIGNVGVGSHFDRLDVASMEIVLSD